MTRLMCSKDAREVQALKRKLFRAGIRSEIRSNPLADRLGISRLEIFIDERDSLKAIKIRQSFKTAADVEATAQSPGNGDRVHGLFEPDEPELEAESEVLASPVNDAPRRGKSGPASQTGLTETEGEFAQATALLEKEVEELLVRENQLSDRCSTLEQELSALDESLTLARTGLTREAANRAAAEKQLAEAGEARAALEKEIQALEDRSHAAEQALAAAQAQLEAHAREAGVRQARIAELTKEVSARDTQLERLAESLAAARATIEQEKSFRLAAEQKSSDLAAARNALESQLALETEQREQLLTERHGEHEQLRACVGRVNDLRTRVRAKLSPKK